MANTFTSNYSFIKSEVGGDNATWGSNLHSTLDLADTAIAKLLEDQLISGITSAAIDLRKDNTANTITTDANLKYFESVNVGDKIRVSGSSAAANGTAAAPVIHTVTAKTSADSITVNTTLEQDTSSTITVAKVLEPVHVNSGPIVCAPLTSLSAATRAAGGVGQPGTGSNKDGTDALKANGDVTLGGDASTDTVTFTSKVASNILPSADNSFDLGASGAEWKDLHVTGTANIDALVSESATITGGAISGGTGSFTTLAVGSGSAPSDGATINMTGYTIGTNGKQNRTVSTSSPSGGSPVNGDIWYEVA